MQPFRPVHINAAAEDFEGNAGRGRFLLLPGSRKRAATIAEQLESVSVKEHPRGHDLHLGVLARGSQSIDIGVVSTGMGCPSVDIIVSELLALGARVLLRVGTAGSLQANVSSGDLVVATAAVRDEATTDAYLPREFPSLASWPMLQAILTASRQTPIDGRVHFGAVHTKDSLYARELDRGPLAEQHVEYRRLLTAAGVLASEMECAHLFALAQLAPRAALAGAILAVIGDHDAPFSAGARGSETETAAVQLALATLMQLATHSGNPR